MYNVRIILFCFILAGTSPAYGQRITAQWKKNIRIEAAQWQVVDILFPGPALAEPAAVDLSFGAAFKTPDAGNINLSGFYDGEGKWICRFSSGKTGIWEFTTYSSNKKLDGLKGTIEITVNTQPDWHGAAGIDPQNPGAFTFEDGTAHFMLAFELDWLFAMDYPGKGNAPGTSSEQLLRRVKENGFNHVVMNVYAYDVTWKTDPNIPSRYSYGRPDYSVFGGSNENPDFGKLNYTLFRHLDNQITLLQRLGLEAHLMIYVWNKKVNWPAMYSAEDNRYFDYVIRRYQAFSNVIWDVSKEALDHGRCDIPYINERIERVRKQDQYKRLVTVHDYEYNSREPDKVDFISIQSWRSQLYSQMLRAKALHTDKPVVNIEHGGYERGPYFTFRGDYSLPETCLIRTYECVFAGVYGSYYWQNTAWNIIIHDPSTSGKDAPHFHYYRHLRSLFDRYSFNGLRPVHSKITTNGKHGEDNFGTNGFTLTNGTTLHLVFLPIDAELTNAVLPKPVGGKLRIKWFHPFTGTYTKEETIDWRSWIEFEKPFTSDPAVAIIESL